MFEPLSDDGRLLLGFIGFSAIIFGAIRIGPNRSRELSTQEFLVKTIVILDDALHFNYSLAPFSNANITNPECAIVRLYGSRVYIGPNPPNEDDVAKPADWQCNAPKCYKVLNIIGSYCIIQ